MFAIAHDLVRVVMLEPTPRQGVESDQVAAFVMSYEPESPRA